MLQKQLGNWNIFIFLIKQTFQTKCLSAFLELYIHLMFKQYWRTVQTQNKQKIYIILNQYKCTDLFVVFKKIIICQHFIIICVEYCKKKKTGLKSLYKTKITHWNRMYLKTLW